MYCPNCGKEIKEGSQFCSFCGSKIVLPRNHCPNCGAEIEGNMETCLT
ncbi:MAG: zinc-ribbon domain-containing protein [Coprobacillus cateniformis]